MANMCWQYYLPSPCNDVRCCQCYRSDGNFLWLWKYYRVSAILWWLSKEKVWSIFQLYRYKCSDPKKYIRPKTQSGDPTPTSSIKCKWDTTWHMSPADFECIGLKQKCALLSPITLHSFSYFSMDLPDISLHSKCQWARQSQSYNHNICFLARRASVQVCWQQCLLERARDKDRPRVQCDMPGNWQFWHNDHLANLRDRYHLPSPCWNSRHRSRHRFDRVNLWIPAINKVWQPFQIVLDQGNLIIILGTNVLIQGSI